MCAARSGAALVMAAQCLCPRRALRRAGRYDRSILFLGIKKSLPYVEVPKQGLKIMKRFRWARLAAAAAFIITMLRMKLAVHGAFGGFLLIHIFFILNLLFIAYQHQNERA